MRFKELPDSEKPREKLSKFGLSSLSSAELIMILLGSGTKYIGVNEVALSLMKKFEDLKTLAQQPPEILRTINGIGEVKAINLSVAFELGRRAAMESLNLDNEKFDSPEIIGGYFMNMLRDKTQEELWVVALNTQKGKIKQGMMFKGTQDSIRVSPREVFAFALENNAHSIVLVHNHPSGSTNPSEHDKIFTQKVAKLGKLLEIELLDHIIVSGTGFFSFHAHRLLGV